MTVSILLYHQNLSGSIPLGKCKPVKCTDLVIRGPESLLKSYLVIWLPHLKCLASYSLPLSKHTGNVCVDVMEFSDYSNLSVHSNHVTSNKHIQHADRHFEGRWEREQWRAKVVVLFISPFLEENNSFSSSAVLVTVGMAVNALGQKALKRSLGSFCQRATATEQTGPPPQSSCPSTLSLIPWLSIRPVSHVNIDPSFLSPVQFKVDWFKRLL